MKRFILGFVALALNSVAFAPTANAICHHCTAPRAVYVRPVYFAPVFYQAPVTHQFQTIGGPTPTTVYDSAPTYGAPETVSVSAPMAVSAPVTIAAPAAEAIVSVEAPQVMAVQPETSHVETTTEAVESVPVESVPVESVPVETVPVETSYQVEAAPIQVAAPVQYVTSTPTFVQTPPANRTTVVESYYQQQQTYFQPAPVIMMQLPAAPARGCFNCRH